MKISFFGVALLLVFIPALTFSQNEKTESLSFTTYFPSPDAVFTRMEVRNKLIVGNITDSNTAANQIANINDITKDQVFVADSIILGSQIAPPTPYRDGQLYFNNTSGVQKLEFYNGTLPWQKLGP